MPALPASQVKIQIHCPQCRGDIEFLEESQVIRCEFCGASLFVTGRGGVLRYIFPPQLQDLEEVRTISLDYLLSQKERSGQISSAFLFYAPFWRIQGMVYRWVFGSKPLKGGSPLCVEGEDSWLPSPMDRTKVLLTRVLDHTVPAYAELPINLPTLGLRVQAIRLRAFESEHLQMRDSFLPPDISWGQVQQEWDRLAGLFFEDGNLTPEVTLQRHAGRRFSLVYFPLWVVQVHRPSGPAVLLIDAVKKSVIQSLPEVESIQRKLQSEGSRKSFAFNEIRFLPFRCPNCGWDFPFQPLSVIHFCPTCRRLWGEKAGSWAELPYQVVPAPEGTKVEELLWVPFWSFHTSIDSTEARLASVADLYRLAPPPRVFNQERESRRPIHLYIPAARFRNPRVVQTLGSRLTFSQPDLASRPFPDGSHPMTAGGAMPESEARDMGAVILGSLIPSRNRKAWKVLKECSLELQNPRIFYLPFVRHHLLCREPSTGLAFQHNALAQDLQQPPS
jgi:predicted Zn-ribbon and HTH transcriptional regulator/DNA-directed RNA polymerase subunit RPC12/RpoP